MAKNNHKDLKMQILIKICRLLVIDSLSIWPEAAYVRKKCDF